MLYSRMRSLVCPYSMHMHRGRHVNLCHSGDIVHQRRHVTLDYLCDANMRRCVCLAMLAPRDVIMFVVRIFVFVV